MTSFVATDASILARRPPRAWFWPGFVIALIATQLTVCAVTFYLAVSEPTFAVEPNYYANAVQWDAHAAQQRRNAALGWTVELRISESEGALQERMLTCVIRDRDGAPIRDATIELTAFPHANATARQALALRSETDGAYSAALQVRTTGLWELRLAVQRGETTFTANEKIEIAPAARRRP